MGHLPPAAHAPLIGEIARWLRPGGFLLTSAPLVVGEGLEDGWLGVPMYFGGIGERAMTDAVYEAGLTLVSAERVGEDEGEGQVVEFLWVTATKPARVTRGAAGRPVAATAERDADAGEADQHQRHQLARSRAWPSTTRPARAAAAGSRLISTPNTRVGIGAARSARSRRG